MHLIYLLKLQGNAMAADISGPEFNLDFETLAWACGAVAQGVWRLTCNNPSPFTFHGTNSYIIGQGSTVAVLDPGPENDAHFEALMRALKGKTVSHIFISHTHRDHSPLARRLKAETGALTVAEGPHRAAVPCMRARQTPLPKAPIWTSCRISRLVMVR